MDPLLVLAQLRQPHDSQAHERDTVAALKVPLLMGHPPLYRVGHPFPGLTPLPLYGWCAAGSTRLLSRYLVTDDPQQAPPDCLEYIPQAKGKTCELRQLYAVSDDSLDVGRRSYWVPMYADGTTACWVDSTGPICCLRRSEALGIAETRVVRVVVGD